MSIAKMKHISLLALSGEKESLLKDIQRLGAVEITETTTKLADTEWSQFLHKDESNIMNVRGELNLLNSALGILKKYVPSKDGLFVLRSEITEADFMNDNFMKDILKKANDINDLERSISNLYSQQSRYKTDILSLKPWESLNLPLETTNTEKTSIILGTSPSINGIGDIQNALYSKFDASVFFEIFSDKEQHYMLIICHKSEEDDVINQLKEFAFSKANFKDKLGTASENIIDLTKRIDQCQKEIDTQIKMLTSYAEDRKNIQICVDRINQEIAKETIKDAVITTGTAFYMEGWLEASKEKEACEIISKYNCAYEITDPQEGDVVPTKLENSKIVEPLNMVTEMYSLPTYDGIDPNPLIFGFYIFFFGFMFADIAYGIIITIISLFITKKYKPKGTMGYMFRLGTMLGISTTICGFLTGGFFGDAITVITSNFMGMEGVALPSVLDPLKNPMQVLMLAIGIGMFQLFVGMCIKLYMSFRDGEALDGILDVVPWWLFFAGVGVVVINGSSVLLIISVITLILTQGRKKNGIIGKLFGGVASLYDVTSWLSDILSYARLMALMLATAVIASVVNILGSLSGSIVVFIIVFIIGHSFNIGINLIGTYVHAARLQYLEFFGRFYKEGGIAFKPLKYDTKYVDIVSEDN